MVCIDRCGFCIHYKGRPKGLMICDAFPDGIPAGYYELEHPGEECANGYRFEVNPSRSDEYDEHQYINPDADSDDTPDIVVGWHKGE